MIPLRDENPSGTPPIVTIAFIVLCVLVFLWQLSFGAQGGERIVYALGVVPAVLLGQGQLPPDLSLVAPWMTIFTSMFMHGGCETPECDLAQCRVARAAPVEQ